ncbi:MAG: hypothetical protein M1833_000490 [Piccolia ochrophora]|nr:MAG: hypothetical protein M1833_000490 [Piccolia ochrophora]
MGQIEELPDDFDTSVNLNGAPPSPPSAPPAAPPSSTKPPPEPPSDDAPPSTAPALPPSLAEIHDRSSAELLEMMNRTPLFMTELDETDGAGGENVDLEALKALAWDGTPFEVADNFRDQGNECFRASKWRDAVEFYEKGLAVLRQESVKRDAPTAETLNPSITSPEETSGPPHPPSSNNDNSSTVDEAARIPALTTSLHLNLAATNLHLRNYRRVLTSCASAIALSPNNPKPYYRSAQALLSLSRLPAAADAVRRASGLAPADPAIATLAKKIETRAAELSAQDRARQEREARVRRERRVLGLALKARRVQFRTTSNPPDLEDAALQLQDKADPASLLTYPLLLLYPLHAQSDFLKAVRETETVGEVLETALPAPWDGPGEYARVEGVECYMETVGGKGLVKVGRKVGVATVLGGGKVEVVDGVVSVFVLPKARVAAWIAEWKRRRGLAGS